MKRIFKKQVVKNSFLNLISRTTVLVISIGFIAFVSRKLNMTEFGIFALLTVLESLTSMIVGIGFPTSAIRLIPELKAKGEETKVADIVKLTILFPTLVSLFITLIGLIEIKFLSSIFLKSEEFAISILWILAISFFYSIFDRIILLYQALQQFGKIAFLSIFTNATQRLLAIIFMVLGFGLKGIFLGFLVGAILGVIIGIFLLGKYIFSRYNGYSLKEFIKFSMPYYWLGWARYAFTQADQILVALIFTPEILAAYFLAKKIVSLVILVFESLLEPVIPKLSEIKTKGIFIFKINMDKVYSAFSFFIFMGVILIFLNSKNFMYLLGGAKFYEDFYLLNVLGISVFFYGIYSISIIGVYLLEHPKEIFKIHLLVGIITILSGVGLGLLFGLNGFALAQSLGYLTGILFIRYKYGNKWISNIWQRDVMFLVLVICGSILFGYYFNKGFLPIVINLSSLIKITILNLAILLLFFAYLIKNKELIFK